MPSPRLAEVRDRLPSLYRPQPGDRGLLTQFLRAVVDALEEVSVDAGDVMNAHWLPYADRALFSRFFLANRRERGLPPRTRRRQRTPRSSPATRTSGTWRDWLRCCRCLRGRSCCRRRAASRRGGRRLRRTGSASGESSRSTATASERSTLCAASSKRNSPSISTRPPSGRTAVSRSKSSRRWPTAQSTCRCAASPPTSSDR